MSVTIRWSTIAKGKKFEQGMSTNLKILEEVFGNELSLDETSIPILRGMAKVDRLTGSFYDEVADAIEKSGAIRIWGEW